MVFYIARLLGFGAEEGRGGGGLSDFTGHCRGLRVAWTFAGASEIVDELGELHVFRGLGGERVGFWHSRVSDSFSFFGEP